MKDNEPRDQSTSETADSEGEYLVSLSPEEVYESTVEYFSQMSDVKIRKRKKPSEVVVEIGSLASPELGDERGSITVQIAEEEGKSRIRVSFSFVLPYLLSGAYWCFVWLILIWVISLVYPGIWGLAFLYNNILLFLTIVFVGLGVGYSVGKTREKFIPQLNLFFRTLEYRRSRQ
jgi:hypothetical protein